MGKERDELDTRCSFCKSSPGNKDKYSGTTGSPWTYTACIRSSLTIVTGPKFG